jgi:hypothetical protein
VGVVGNVEGTGKSRALIVTLSSAGESWVTTALPLEWLAIFVAWRGRV